MSYRKDKERYLRRIKSALGSGKAFEDLWETHYKQFDCTLFDLLALFIRIKSSKVTKLLHSMHGILTPDEYTMKLPFCYQSITKPKDGLVVFENLALACGWASAADMLPNITCFTKGELLSPSLEAMVQLRAQAKGERAKALDTDRKAFKFLTRATEMNVSTFVAKFILPGGTADLIRNKAVAIQDVIAPVEIRIEHDNADVFAEMYENGPTSCMTGKDKNWKQYNGVFHPTQFYAACPLTSIAGIKKGGKYLTRCILFHTKLDNGKVRTQYGRIYSASAPHTNSFVKELRERGYTPLDGMIDLPVGTEFRLKADLIPEAKDYLAPVPYFDNIAASALYVTFDAKRREFVYSTSAKIVSKDEGGLARKLPNGVALGSTTAGFIKAKSIFGGVQCDWCGGAGSSTINCEDGSVFCSAPCITAAGYVVAYDGLNMQHIIPKNIAIFEISHGVHYTNVEAARRRLDCFMFKALSSVRDIRAFTPKLPWVHYLAVNTRSKSGIVYTWKGEEVAICNPVAAKLKAGPTGGFELLYGGIINSAVDYRKEIDW